MTQSLLNFEPSDLWRLSSSSDPEALAIVDGLGRFDGHGHHYSRRTPGSKTFTGIGQEVVLVSKDGSAVWAVVLQKTPSKRGSGSSRGRKGEPDKSTRYLWRNNMFRNLGDTLSSALIEAAVTATYEAWKIKYETLPAIRMRTEIDIKKVRSRNPGYCYKCAGWNGGHIVRGKLYLYAPEVTS